MNRALYIRITEDGETLSRRPPKGESGVVVVKVDLIGEKETP